MTLSDYDRHTCKDHSHIHLSNTELEELDDNCAIDWLRGSRAGLSVKQRSKMPKCVVKIRRFFAARGLSCSVGGELAEMLASEQRRGIGNVMFAHIKMRSEEGSQCTTS